MAIQNKRLATILFIVAAVLSAAAAAVHYAKSGEVKYSYIVIAITFAIIALTSRRR